MKKYALLLLGAALIAGCKSDDKEDDQAEGGDVARLLQHTGEQYFVPKYVDYAEETASLHDVAEDFTNNPTTGKLEDLRETFLNTYIKWQSTGIGDFGPATNIQLLSATNSYPTDTSIVNENIETGDYNLNSPTSTKAVGLPALDFLLYGMEKSDEEIVTLFTTDEHATARQDYLTALTERLNSTAETVASDWDPSEGDYLDVYVSNTGSDAGSSLTQMTNAFIRYYESHIRNGKVAVPVGRRSADPLPERVESLYGEHSVVLLKESVQGIKDYFMGMSADGTTDGFGLYDHLMTLNTDLAKTTANDIKDQLDVILEDLEKYNNPLNEEIETNQSQVDETFVKLQQLIPLFKVDMVSALGISITYEDNDGD